MGTAEKVWSGLGVALFGLVGVSAMTPSSSATTPLAVSTSTESPVRSTVTVTEVLSGDTVRAGDQVIRVLGISSCDPSTPGGAEAEQMAEALLGGREITVRTQPGLDRDASGRLLRSIDLAYGGDYGHFMVASPHTGPDASNGVDRQTVASLREDDGNGRSCG